MPNAPLPRRRLIEPASTLSTRPPPPEESISDDAATEFSTLASRLSDRLVAIEKFLASRPGTVKTALEFETEERTHRLEWRRVGKVWQLWVWDVPSLEEAEEGRNEEGAVPTGMNGRPLTQCSLDVKIAAAEVMPSLLETITQGELKSIERLKAVHARLDQLADKLPEGI